MRAYLLKLRLVGQSGGYARLNSPGSWDGTRIMTDQFQSYKGLDKEFASHEVVNHAEGEYARGDAHTNTAEGYFANLKRGLNGSYHHVSHKHLHRYLSEFDFRWNAREASDSARTVAALSQAEGKRLRYRQRAG